MVNLPLLQEAEKIDGKFRTQISTPIIHVKTMRYYIERQRHNKQINYTQDSSFFPRKNKELP